MSGICSASGGGAADDDEFENPCPVCLDNEDDAYVDGKTSGQCSACGQMVCGACNAGISATQKCPTCRAPLIVSHEEVFKRLWKLVHNRSPGRHTPAAQNRLGLAYADGTGVGQDGKEAVKWYRCAADQGDGSAQFNLGKMYGNGQGVEQDDKEAVKWYRLAAEHGFAAAQCNLGVAYANGEGVAQDYAEAVKWVQLSAVQGQKEALKVLGIMYYNGQGVPQDDAEAVKWFQLAAVQGQESSLRNLGGMQEGNLIPTPPPGTTITTVLLTSAKTAKLNNKTGVVVAAPSPAMVRPGIAFVLLGGEDHPKMLKLMNLRV